MHEFVKGKTLIPPEDDLFPFPPDATHGADWILNRFKKVQVNPIGFKIGDLPAVQKTLIPLKTAMKDKIFLQVNKNKMPSLSKDNVVMAQYWINLGKDEVENFFPSEKESNRLKKVEQFLTHEFQDFPDTFGTFNKLDSLHVIVEKHELLPESFRDAYFFLGNSDFEEFCNANLNED